MCIADVEQGRGEDIVTHQHGHLIVEHRIDALLSTPLAAFVHDIVVHE